jgi:hypothetical protein
MQVPSSPEKASLLDTNAAAHKRQQETLSSDDKAKILNKDADAHKKQWEALSPEENFVE